MVRLRLRNIDDNSPRHPYLFETKPWKLSLIKRFDSSDECNFRNDTYSLYKLMLSLLNITFPSLNLSWYVWFCHIFIANKEKFSNHFLINFFVGKTKSKCPISFHLVFISGGNSSLSLSVSISVTLLSSTFSSTHCCSNNVVAI